MTYLHCAECQKKIKLEQSHKCVALRCMDCGSLFCPVCDGIGEEFDVADVLVMAPHQCGVCLKMTDARGGVRSTPFRWKEWTKIGITDIMKKPFEEAGE